MYKIRLQAVYSGGGKGLGGALMEPLGCLVRGNPLGMNDWKVVLSGLLCGGR